MFHSCFCLPSPIENEDFPYGSYRPSLHDFSPEIQEELRLSLHSGNLIHKENFSKADEHISNLRNEISSAILPRTKALPEVQDDYRNGTNLERSVVSQNIRDKSRDIISLNSTLDTKGQNFELRTKVDSIYRKPIYSYYNGGAMTKADPEETPHLLPNESVVRLYKDARCIFEYISGQKITGTLVVTNFKIHFLSDKNDSGTENISSLRKSPAGRNIILDMPLGFVSKVEPVGNDLIPIKIKVHCKDLRFFTLIINKASIEIHKNFLQNINNPLLSVLVNWISKRVMIGKEKMKSKDKAGSFDLELESSSSRSFMGKKLSRQYSKSLNNLDKETKLDHLSKTNFKLNYLPELNSRLMKKE